MSLLAYHRSPAVTFVGLNTSDRSCHNGQRASEGVAALRKDRRRDRRRVGRQRREGTRGILNRLADSTVATDFSPISGTFIA